MVPEFFFFFSRLIPVMGKESEIFKLHTVMLCMDSVQGHLGPFGDWVAICSPLILHYFHKFVCKVKIEWHLCPYHLTLATFFHKSSITGYEKCIF